MKRKTFLPIVIELVGISVIGVGIGLELAIGGDIYLAVITIGSCMVAAGGIIWGKFMRRGQ